MADFGTNAINLVYNTNTDASPTWTGTAINFSGSAGANELRWCASGAGGTTTASASWPFYTRPGSTAIVADMWAFTSDAVGLKVATYGGTNGNANANVVRWSWDNSGTFAAAPQFSGFGSSSHTTPVGNDQTTATGAGGPIINGSADTLASSVYYSYLKINAWGSLIATTGTQVATGAVGTNPTVTTGTNSSVTTTSADWLNTHGIWQSAQGWIQYIVFGSTPAATTANTWPWTLLLFTGPNMATGTLTPVITFQYAYS